MWEIIADPEDYGIEALEEGPTGATETLSTLLDTLGEFTGITRPFDDMTIIALSPK